MIPPARKERGDWYPVHPFFVDRAETCYEFIWFLAVDVVRLRRRSKLCGGGCHLRCHRMLPPWIQRLLTVYLTEELARRVRVPEM